MREGGVFEAPHRDAESDGARGGGGHVSLSCSGSRLKRPRTSVRFGAGEGRGAIGARG